eukprot:scaffold128850_cov63-Phaeocystis_antarctica.AAC.1
MLDFSQDNRVRAFRACEFIVRHGKYDMLSFESRCARTATVVEATRPYVRQAAAGARGWPGPEHGLSAVSRVATALSALLAPV